MDAKQPEYLQLLFRAFPDGFINSSNDFIFEIKGNVYINLSSVESVKDAQAKVLEFCSRTANKGIVYSSEWRNREYRARLREGLNIIIGKDLDEDEWGLVYCHLGNRINHAMTMAFLESGCDMSVLEKECKGRCLDNCPSHKSREKTQKKEFE